jgi:DNA uptake protein ComE-like DNA-binding protein
VSDQKEVDISKKIKKEEMVVFLASSGKIKDDLAGSLYDQGLNSWKVLVEGTEEFFVGLKKIGPAKAKILIELASKKKEELGTVRPGLKEILETVPRMSQRIISSLLESGYDSFESFKDKTAEDLEQIKGIGPKMSGAIIKAVQEHIEVFGAEDTEEATAEVVEEGEEGPKDERSLIQRITDAISGLLGGKKKEGDEEPKEEEKAEEAPEEEVDEAPEEVPEEVPVPEEEQVEEPPEEVPKEKDSEPEEEETEKEISEDSEEEKEEEISEETAEEAPKEEKGFFDKLKAMFFGGSKKEETSEEEKTEGEETPEDASSPAEETSAEPPEEEKTAEEVPEKKTFEDFEDIPGVSKKTAEMLKGAGYLNVDELREAVPEDLTMIDGIGPKTAEKICNALKK